LNRTNQQRMKKTYLWMMGVVLLLIFQACTTSYVTQVGSNSSAEQDQTGAFVFENDTLKVWYRFFGYDAPLQATILNKSDRPLVIDWQQSAIAFDQKMFSYEGHELKDNEYLPAQESIIPAGKSMQNIPIFLLDYIPLSFDANALKPEKIQAVNGSWLNAKTIQYAVSESPLFFKNYISYRLDNEENYKDFSQEFYIRKIAKLKNVKIEDIPAVSEQRSDIFMVRKKNSNRFLNHVGVGFMTGGIGVGFGVGGFIF